MNFQASKAAPETANYKLGAYNVGDVLRASLTMDSMPSSKIGSRDLEDF